jgi:tetratricopeptide (TPR) repeat protein
MLRSRTVLANVLLIVTVACPVMAFGYINGGKRDKSYYAERSRRETEQRQKEYEKLAVLNSAIQRDPQDVVAVYQRGKFFAEHGEWDRAMGDFFRAIELDPQFARPYFRRSFGWMRQRRSRHALEDLDEAIRLEPAFVPAHFHRAVFLLFCPERELRNLDQARQSAQTAYDLAEKARVLGDPHRSLDDRAHEANQVARCCALLGVIAAERGDLPAAVEWETKVSQLPQCGESPRLALYRVGQTDRSMRSDMAGYLQRPAE